MRTSFLAAIGLVCACSAPARHPPIAAATSEPAPEARAPEPSAVPGSPTLVAFGTHACAIEGGRVHCWGRMSSEGEPSPPFWVPDLDGAEELAAAGSFACARTRRPGRVVCWGLYLPGTDERQDDLTRPVAIEGWEDVVDLDAFGGDLCAVRRDGAVLCRVVRRSSDYLPRLNARGQIEDVDDAVSVAVGSRFVCVLRRQGKVSCAGAYGPDESDGEDQYPAGHPMVEVEGLGDVIQIEAGGGSVCAVERSGEVACWGELTVGQAGGGTVRSLRAVRMPAVGRARSLSAAWTHACAVLEGGRVACWGTGFHGELGDGVLEETPRLASVAGMEGAIEVATGEGFSCARHRGGRVSCWGLNDVGEIGTGQPSPDAIVTTIPLTSVTDVEIGETHTCALATGGRVACWGASHTGQLGSPGPRTRTPRWIEGMSGVAQLSVGGATTCARSADGAMRWWGYDFYGLPRGSEREQPTTLPNLPVAQAVAVANSFACFLDLRGGVLCWSANESGQVDSRLGRDVPRPVRVGVGRAAAISVGIDRSCALLADGTVWSWGGPESKRPHQVPGITGAVEVSCSYGPSCARSGEGQVSCWSYDETVRRLPIAGASAVQCASSGCCAIAAGSIQCWGDIHGAPRSLREPERHRPPGMRESPRLWSLPARDPIALAVGRESACWVERGGVLRCWGAVNPNGELGVSSEDLVLRPTAVAVPPR